MKTHETLRKDELTDAALVGLVAAGDRLAFGTLVSRYQNLVCSIAYGIVGDFKRSEEIAQDSFLTAWKSLPTLKDPESIRPWLCGISRNLALKSLRREKDVSWQSINDSLLDPASPPDVHLMACEEETLVWKSLSSLPENYREPLILFYREEQSVARVAEALGLSEGNVRQRLSRGRDLLRDSVTAMIDRTLSVSRPGPAFTLSVMGALPGILVASAGAATAATPGGAAKIGALSAAAKATAGAGWIGGFVGVAGGLLGAWVGHWAGVQSARSDRQRDFLKSSFRPIVIASLIYVLPLLVVPLASVGSGAISGPRFIVALMVWTLGFVAYVLQQSFWIQRRSREILVEDEAQGLTREPDSGLHRFASQWEGREWKTRAQCCGLPLIHIHFSDPGQSSAVPRTTVLSGWRRAPVARGWIAIGERAHGVLLGVGGFASGLFAMGGCAVGGVALGGVSCGLISFGGLALGALAIGGLSVGGWAWGGMALGWMAFGGMAIAWKAADGGMAIAQEFAVGGLAIAEHANTPTANTFIENDPFFVTSVALVPLMSSPWAFVVLTAFSLVPTALILSVGYRRKGRGREGRPRVRD